MLLSLEGEGEETVGARERGAGLLTPPTSSLLLVSKLGNGQNHRAENQEPEDHLDGRGLDDWSGRLGRSQAGLGVMSVGKSELEKSPTNTRRPGHGHARDLYILLLGLYSLHIGIGISQNKSDHLNWTLFTWF